MQPHRHPPTIESLAERGRAARIATEVQTIRDADQLARERRRYAERSTQRGGAATGPAIFWAFMGTVCTVTLLAARALSWALVPAAVVALSVTFLRRVRRAGAATYERHVAWVTALPFVVRGYLESLGTPREALTQDRVINVFTPIAVAVDLEWAAAAGLHNAPAVTSVLLADVLAGVDGELRVLSQDGAVVRCVRPRLMHLGRGNNYALYRWFGELVARALLPLHAQRPLASVTLRLVTGDATRPADPPARAP